MSGAGGEQVALSARVVESEAAVADAQPAHEGQGGEEGTPRHHQYQTLPSLHATDEGDRRFGKARVMAYQPQDARYTGRQKRSSAGCIQFFAKGTCAYGSRCKFSHDRNASLFASSGYRKYARGAPKSSPLVMAVPPHACSSPSSYPELAPTRNIPVNNSQELLFPALPGHREYQRVCADVESSRPTSPMSPSKKLLFKDAVLKRGKAREEADMDAAGPHSRGVVNHDQCHTREGSLGANSRLDPDAKLNSHRHKLGHRRDWPSYDRRRSATFELGEPSHRYDCQLPPAESVLHGGDCRCLPPRSPTFTQPRVQPLREACPTLGLEDALYSNLSVHAEALLACLDAGLAAIEPVQLEAVTALRTTVSSRWPDTLVDVYGSNYTRLALPMSDIDCVLMSKSLSGESPFKVLKELEELVQAQPWAQRVDFLGSAKIPVLKITFLSATSNVEVLLDLTCGHSLGHSGLSARDLIYSCQAEMPALRPLVMILKCHLHSFDLNCAFTGGLSSYALVIMVIRFLQACGDEHFKSYDNSMARKIERLRHRSWSDGIHPYGTSASAVTASGVARPGLKATWCYTFSRGDCITWRTGVGNLLLLFLETYIAFDYRRYGISINKGGEYFPLPLPADKTMPESCSTVTPFIIDPIKRGRNIGNCFRMNEVVQAWFVLYQNLMAGASLEACVAQRLNFETS